jgi:23S rRNA pseudouridine2605 synthase
LLTFAPTNCTENQNIMSEKSENPRPFRSNSNNKFPGRKPTGNKRHFAKKDSYTPNANIPSNKDPEERDAIRNKYTENGRRKERGSPSFRSKDSSSRDKLSDGSKRSRDKQFREDRPFHRNDRPANTFNNNKEKHTRHSDDSRSTSANRYGKSTYPSSKPAGRAIINYPSKDAFRDSDDNKHHDSTSTEREIAKSGRQERKAFSDKSQNKTDVGFTRHSHFSDKKPYARRDNEDRRPSEGKRHDRNTERYEKKKYPSTGSYEKREVNIKTGDRDHDWKKRKTSSEHSLKKDEKVDRPYIPRARSIPKNFFSDKLRRNIQSPEKAVVKERNIDTNKEIRLNKYIAEHGLCSRREADVFIASGVVSVNGVVVTAMGVKVLPGDEIKFNGERLHEEKKVYLLLNKPKDYITTLEDPNAKKTVMELIRGACKERIYPVGRLDRNSTGVLLFTNDGDLTRKLTHPSFHKKKVYHVFLNKVLKPVDLHKIMTGVELEDGIVKADEISYVDEADKTQVGVEIHSGQNRIVRRMFEELGYNVKKLDRVYFAGLTKKGLQRGEWRFLNDKEIRMLKTGSYD